MTTEQHFTEENFMRAWDDQGFRLEIFETKIPVDPETKHTAIAYRLWDDTFRTDTARAPIFEGADFWVSSLHAIDSDAAMGGLLSFLALLPGGPDANYFDDYTERQLAWRDERAEELSMSAYEAFGER